MSSNPVFSGSYMANNDKPKLFDARAKLLSAAGLTVGVSVIHSVAGLIVLGVGVVALLTVNGVSLRSYTQHMRLFVWLALLAVVLGTGPGGKTLLQMGAWRYTTGDALSGAWVGGRILLLISAVMWLSLTTSATDLVQGLLSLLAPLRKLKVPVDAFALAVLVALRFIPVIADEVRRVRQAQAARGVECVAGVRGIWRRTTSLIVPVFAAVIRRADTLADALVARGFRSGVITVRLVTKLTLKDYILVGLCWMVALSGYIL
jgi:energy-coupling factor transport system permease protein